MSMLKDALESGKFGVTAEMAPPKGYDFAEQMEAKVIVRGLRAVTDFEYELQMSQTNRKLNSDVETLFLTTSLEYSYLSSTTVKEVASFGGDISQFVPEFVAGKITDKIKQKE